MRVAVARLGLWTPGFADVAGWRGAVADPGVTAPHTAQVPSRHLRFTSVLTRMAIAAYEQVVAGEPDVAAIPVVFGSAAGEIQIAVELLDRVAAAGGASPARFMNSVHNTVPGHLAIATASHGQHTALAGGAQTAAAALIEAWGLLAAGASRVAVVVGDESLPAPLADRPARRYPSLAVGLLLRRGDGGVALARPRIDRSIAPYGGPLADNPCSPALGLLDAVLARRPGPVRLDREGDDGWCVDLSPEAA